MFEHKRLQKLEDFFVECNKRREQGIYFYRINGWSEEINQFLQKYYETARVSGVVIEGRIPNPDEKNLAYYSEMMGMHFELSTGFIEESLKKWLPRMNNYQRQNVASSLYEVLVTMQQQGKNISMLKNAYIKYMCWMYYKFERVLSRLGEQVIPKILYGGSISDNEFKLMTILAHAGCDIVLVQYEGDESYKKLDPTSQVSYIYEEPQSVLFPPHFNLTYLRNELEKKMTMERLYGQLPHVVPCTNTWIQGVGLEDIMKSVTTRGQDTSFFYNCFYRINGVKDKSNYLNALYQIKTKLEEQGRKLLILEHTITPPTVEELKSIQRKTYQNEQQLISDLARQIHYSANQELERIMRKAFIDILLQESKKESSNLNRLINKAIYLLCWLKRYQSKLFSNWKIPDIGCCFYLGACQNKYEVIFLKFLAHLPVDVIVLRTDLTVPCQLEDTCLYEVNYRYSMQVEHFPKAYVQVDTAAYQAENELNTLLYQESGIYGNQQYKKANTITLQTMYEELFILWDQELKYRENFGVVGEVVNVPVIFAKISGVKEGQVQQYWDTIKTMGTEETLIIRQAPYIKGTKENPIKPYCVEFFKKDRLQKAKIKAHKQYPYSFLREEMQEHILDKLECLINQKIIKGTFEKGTEYTIIATVLDLDKTIVRMIQKFDFTKKNPKLIYINTTEKMISLEDTIVTAFLNLVGFDIVFFVPTGYQCIERFFNEVQIKEHQVGEYLYDLQVPEFNKNSVNTGTSWYQKIFKRGE